MGFDSIHWYASPATKDLGLDVSVGNSVDQVPAADGKRMISSINSGHAKKFALGPGVTGVLNMLAKPALVSWGENNSLAAAVVDPETGEVSPTSSLAAKLFAGEITLKWFQDQARALKTLIAKKAASGGSEIHDKIEAFFVHGLYPNDPYVKLAREEVEKITSYLFSELGWEYVGAEAEYSFFHPLGFGGRTDLTLRFKSEHGEHIYVIDWKTREFDEQDAIKAKLGLAKGNRTFGRLTPRETEPMQIAANIEGQGGCVLVGDLGANVYLSRTQHNAAFTVPYTGEQLEHAWSSFRGLLTVFINLKLK